VTIIIATNGDGKPDCDAKQAVLVSSPPRRVMAIASSSDPKGAIEQEKQTVRVTMQKTQRRRRRVLSGRDQADADGRNRQFERLMRAAGAAAAKVRRRDLHSLGPTSIIVSLDPVELGSLEVWIAGQPDPQPSREEVSPAAYRPGVGEEMTPHAKPSTESTSGQDGRGR
jgi:hypothetical protein